MHLFPFTAVLGQERLKLALLLCAIDPGIGGVLVRGPRGVAKTTLARAFSALLPGRFVELPLGATEERVTGSLDLGKALGQGEVLFSPGLLAKAHDGVLYVDEVNLLPDALVDLLLDAAATGQNVIERDAVSHVHAARFVLVGTMNPEEGELRPQLCDRFGLSVVAENVLTTEERTAVVLRRLEFEGDPERFMAGFADEQRALHERCRAAHRRLKELPFAGPGVARAAELCHAAGVDGVRADLAMLRAARAHAAWREHSEISEGDVDAVAELALAHRRRGPAPGGGRDAGGRSGGSSDDGSRSEPGQSPGARSSRLAPRPDDAGSRPRAGSAEAARGGLDATPAGDALAGPRRGTPGGGGEQAGSSALAPVAVHSAAPPTLPRWFLESSGIRRAAPPFAARSRASRPSAQRRATQRQRRGAYALGEGAIDWFATLLQRRQDPGAMRVDIERRPRRLARAGRWVIALDCSASMLQSGALGVAKGVARALVSRAASASADLALVSFGGADVSAQPASEGGTAAIARAIAALGAGGGTPLRRAVQIGLELASRAAPSSVERRLLIFTDGRTRESVNHLGSTYPNVDVTVIDCERGALRLGRAHRVAAALHGRYVHIEWLADC
jgi:magnesium chelatase subunit D